MDYSRAQEIINSPQDIEVLHQGESVWLLNLDQNSQKAKVSKGPNFSVESLVPLNELREIGPKA